MKKILRLIFTFLFVAAAVCRIFFPAFTKAETSYAADAQYARVVSESAVFYRTNSGSPDIENKYFTLPKDYFVFLESASDSGFYKVSYDVFTGYVKAEDIDIVSYTPKLKYAAGQTLKIETPDGGNCNLREFAVKTAAKMIENGISDETADIKFYNYVDAGADKWYFVEYAGRLGYVFGDYAVITREIAPNDGAAEPGPDNPRSGADTPKPLDTLTIVILAAVIGIPAIAILLLLFKPRRRRPPAYSARGEVQRIPRYLDDEE